MNGLAMPIGRNLRTDNGRELVSGVFRLADILLQVAFSLQHVVGATLRFWNRGRTKTAAPNRQREEDGPGRTADR